MNLLLCLLCFLAHLVVVAGFTGWLEPPSDRPDLYRTYYFGDTVYLTWSNITFPRVKLRITYWAVDQEKTIGVLLNNASNYDALTWQIGRNDNITLAKIVDPKFCLRLSDDAQTFTWFSRGFLILPPRPTLSATASITPTSTTATPSSSATTSATPKPSAGLSDGAKVGVGVGLPLGALLVASWVLFFLRRRKQAATVATMATMVTIPDKVQPMPYVEVNGSYPPRGELPASTPGSELYGDPRY